MLFDVFGTLVDWHGSLARQADGFFRGGVGRGEVLAREWRESYGPMMDRVRRRETGWANLDQLNRLFAERFMAAQGKALNAREVDQVMGFWRRLEPWPDVAEGLARLRRRFVVATLSNAGVASLTRLARHGGMTFDCILSAELFRRYKPDPETYLGAVALLDVRPEEAMMAAAHGDDLAAASALGLRTAFVRRAREWGDRESPERPEPAFDIVADDLVDLAARLAA